MMSSTRRGVGRRPRSLWLAALLCVASLGAGDARADTTLQILDVYPEPPTALGRAQPFSLRVAYVTSEPVAIAAHASFAGRPMPGMSGGEPHVGVGQGEVLLWIGYYGARQIDLVAVTATAASGSIAAQIERPLALSWTGQPTPWPAPPEWLQRMTAERERQAKAAYQTMMNSPQMAAMEPVAVALMLTVPFYFVVQFLVLWRWRGGWRKVAMAPLWPMGAVLVYTVYAFLDGSNLFPLVLIFTAPLAFLYLLLLLALRGLNRLIGPGSSL